MTVDAPALSRRAAAVDVAFNPADVRPTEVAVVVDVLRASSTIAAALHAGYSQVHCAGTIERARELRGPGRALAGEQACERIEGFDYGNSPRAFGRAHGGELVLCTTNGTPAVLAAAAVADRVLLASLLNLDAVVGAIPAGGAVTVVCSGTDGSFALEDAYVAGRIVERLAGERSDAARAAERLAGAYRDPFDPLADSADAVVLRATGQEEDIAFCARESVLAVVPQVTAVGDGVATVRDVTPEEPFADENGEPSHSVIPMGSA